jgi:hypothetical protein
MTGMLKGRKKLFRKVFLLINICLESNMTTTTRQANLMDASVITSDEISKIFNSTMQASPRIGTSSPQGTFGGYRRSLNRDFRKKEL